MNNTQSPHLSGLSDEEVAAQIRAGHTNQTEERTSRSVSSILRSNILTRFNAIVLILTLVVVSVGSLVDALFGGIAVLNSAIGIFQELRAKRTLDRLAILHAPVAHVVREGVTKEVQLKDIVLGDTLYLQTGDQIAVDSKVLMSEGLEVDESLLTGESDPIFKTPSDTVRSGSFVVAGKGYAQATAVGADTYVHSITKQVKRFSIAPSELVNGTNRLLKYISWIIVISSPIIVWGQIVRSGNGWQESVIRSTAAIDGMIPQGLVLLTSLSFMLATLALARRKVLVQQLPAVEGLARVDVICLDKTGTLTEGSIVLDRLEILDAKQQAAAEDILAQFSADPNSPTLQALHQAYKTNSTAARSTVPFSSSRKWSAMESAGTHWIMGAPEMIITDASDTVRARVAEHASKGNRVLLLASSHHAPRDMKLPAVITPVALIILKEKVRADAKATLEFFAKQGVELKIISGDSPQTVGAIATAVGLKNATAIDARTLPTDEEELAIVLANQSVFGRVSPDQKRQMVKALQSSGHVVAMTGDGVNDVLALKDADIGIAMGNGAQATKAIAELVLLDSQFAQMPRVLAEGRRVIANIERVASFFIIKNVYSLVLALSVTLAALPYPFLPRHLTILSALTIGIPAFLLSLAPNNRRYISGFLGRVLGFAVPVGIMSAIAIFANHLLIERDGGSPELASTMASILVMTIGMWVLACLARPMSLWKVALVAGLAGAFAILLAIPFIRELAEFELQASYLAQTFGFGVLVGIGTEYFWRRNQRSAPLQQATKA
jgi:cation-transporting ATPase E